MECVDKYKEAEIRLEKFDLLRLPKREVVLVMADRDSEMLNSVYKEISEKMGVDAAMELYQMFKGQQICFPVRFFNPVKIRQIIIEEYDGTNVRSLATKYDYSEKTIRRIIKNRLEEREMNG